MTLTKFSDSKHSTIMNEATENRLLRSVPMETVTNGFCFKFAPLRYQDLLDMLITQELQS